MKKLVLITALFPSGLFFCQGKLVLSNAFLVIDNNAKLVIENPLNDAISNSGSGGIKTESEFDQVIWKIGTNTGVYTLPFVGSVANIQIPFTANITGSGVGAGEIRFSTYPGATWDNNSYRPSDVTHMFDYNTNTINNSLYVIDRFWVIDPLNYTSLPAGTFDFGYIDNEHLQVGNAIVETDLGAQRFNNGSNVWGDYLPQGSVNTISNTVSGVPVLNSNFYRSWTLSLSTSPYKCFV